MNTPSPDRPREFAGPFAPATSTDDTQNHRATPTPPTSSRWPMPDSSADSTGTQPPRSIANFLVRLPLVAVAFAFGCIAAVLGIALTYGLVVGTFAAIGATVAFFVGESPVWGAIIGTIMAGIAIFVIPSLD